MNDNVIRDALELYESGEWRWIQEDFVGSVISSTQNKWNVKYDMACIYGALALAGGMSAIEIEYWWSQEDLGPNEGTYDICSQTAQNIVRDVISEQFPDRMDGVYHKDSGTRSWKPITDPVLVITYFNDHDDTTYEDVRLVLEKAAIKLDEHV